MLDRTRVLWLVTCCEQSGEDGCVVWDMTCFQYSRRSMVPAAPVVSYLICRNRTASVQHLYENFSLFYSFCYHDTCKISFTICVVQRESPNCKVVVAAFQILSSRSDALCPFRAWITYCRPCRGHSVVFVQRDISTLDLDGWMVKCFVPDGCLSYAAFGKEFLRWCCRVLGVIKRKRGLGSGLRIVAAAKLRSVGFECRVNFLSKVLEEFR